MAGKTSPQDEKTRQEQPNQAAGPRAHNSNETPAQKADRLIEENDIREPLHDAAHTLTQHAHFDLEGLNRNDMIATLESFDKLETLSEQALKNPEHSRIMMNTLAKNMRSADGLDEIIDDLLEDGDIDNQAGFEAVFGKNNEAIQNALGNLAAQGAGGAFTTAQTQNHNGDTSPEAKAKRKAQEQQATQNFLTLSGVLIPPHIEEFLNSEEQKATMNATLATVFATDDQDKKVKIMVEGVNNLSKDLRDQGMTKEDADKTSLSWHEKSHVEYLMKEKGLPREEALAKSQELFTGVREQIMQDKGLTKDEANKAIYDSLEKSLKSENVSKDAYFKSIDAWKERNENPNRQIEKPQDQIAIETALTALTGKVTELQSNLDAGYDQMEAKVDALPEHLKPYGKIIMENAKQVWSNNASGEIPLNLPESLSAEDLKTLETLENELTNTAGDLAFDKEDIEGYGKTIQILTTSLNELLQSEQEQLLSSHSDIAVLEDTGAPDFLTNAVKYNAAEQQGGLAETQQSYHEASLAVNALEKSLGKFGLTSSDSGLDGLNEDAFNAALFKEIEGLDFGMGDTENDPAQETDGLNLGLESIDLFNPRHSEEAAKQLFPDPVSLNDSATAETTPELRKSFNSTAPNTNATPQQAANAATTETSEELNFDRDFQKEAERTAAIEEVKATLDNGPITETDLKDMAEFYDIPTEELAKAIEENGNEIVSSEAPSETQTFETPAETKNEQLLAEVDKQIVDAQIEAQQPAPATPIMGA